MQKNMYSAVSVWQIYSLTTLYSHKDINEISQTILNIFNPLLLILNRKLNKLIFLLTGVENTNSNYISYVTIVHY